MNLPMETTHTIASVILICVIFHLFVVHNAQLHESTLRRIVLIAFTICGIMFWPLIWKVSFECNCKFSKCGAFLPILILLYDLFSLIRNDEERPIVSAFDPSATLGLTLGMYGMLNNNEEEKRTLMVVVATCIIRMSISKSKGNDVFIDGMHRVIGAYSMGIVLASIGKIVSG